MFWIIQEDLDKSDEVKIGVERVDNGAISDEENRDNTEACNGHVEILLFRFFIGTVWIEVVHDEGVHPESVA